MKKIGKGCLGCLGGLFLVILVAVIGIGTMASRSNKSVKENYVTYTVEDVTYQLPTSWEVEEENKQVFYPDEDSVLYVTYTSDLDILNETERAGFVEGLKTSGTISDEAKYTKNGKEGYSYSVVVTNEEGKELPGKLFTINANQGAVSFLYISISKKSDKHVKVLEKTISQMEIQESKDSSQASSSSEVVASSSEVVSSSFVATDTSDATIESIVTYGDYLDMYELIVNEYVSNYEVAVQQYGLGNATVYQGMRDQVTATIDQQKAQYGSMKDTKIVGKEDIVQFLKEYRDQLKGFTDQMAAGF